MNLPHSLPPPLISDSIVYIKNVLPKGIQSRYLQQQLAMELLEEFFHITSDCYFCTYEL